MEQPRIVDLPYDERRIIVVTDKVPSGAAEPPSSRTGAPGSSTLPLTPASIAWVLGGIFGAAAVKAIIDAIKEFRKAGEAIVPIDWETARTLRFPPGHPRKHVVYVGHPVDAGSYIPTADFHRFLFQHKVAEAQRLIRSLGAVSMQVVHIQGWDRNAAAKMGLGLPEAAGADVEVGAEAGRTDSAKNQVLMTMKLKPAGEPRVPTDLVWTPHEPLWQEVAAARTESGLTEFVIDVRSTDDFGVNADLKILIQKAGLDAGGKFFEHQDTVWRLEGTFSQH